MPRRRYVNPVHKKAMASLSSSEWTDLETVYIDGRTLRALTSRGWIEREVGQIRLTDSGVEALERAGNDESVEDLIT